MSIANYGELKTAVANTLNRSDPTARIPEFIKYAESRIRAQIQGREQIVRSQTTIDEEFEDLPSDFLGIISIKTESDTDNQLQYLAPEELIKKHPSTTSGTPKYYTIIGEKFQFRPIPSSATLEITYRAANATLATDSDFNDLLTNYPHIYLYGALMAAEPWLGNDERLPVWKSEFDILVDAINLEAERSSYGRLTPRVNTPTP